MEILKFILSVVLTIAGAAAAGYTQGGTVGAIVAGSAAGAGLLQKSPQDRLKEHKRRQEALAWDKHITEVKKKRAAETKKE